MIIFISDDEFTQHHVGTLDDHDATKDTMSKNQQRYLTELLQDMLMIYEQHNDKKRYILIRYREFIVYN